MDAGTTLNWTGGARTSTTSSNHSKTVISNLAGLTLSTGDTLDRVGLDNYGTIYWDAGMQGGNLTLSGDAYIRNYNGSQCNVTNGGLINVNTAASPGSNFTVDPGGTLNVNGNTILQMFANFNAQGTIHIDSTSTIDARYIATLSGTLTIGVGGFFEFDQIDGFATDQTMIDLTQTGGGTIQFLATLAYAELNAWGTDNIRNFEVPNNNIGGVSGTSASELDINGGSFSWGGGYLDNALKLDIKNNGQLAINPGAGNTVGLDNAAYIVNDAFVTWRSGTIDIGGTVAPNGAPIQNNGVFDILGDLNLTESASWEATEFANYGTLKKSGGTGIANMFDYYTGTGAVTVSSGSIQFLNQTFS
jgi:hypothetical protein